MPSKFGMYGLLWKYRNNSNVIYDFDIIIFFMLNDQMNSFIDTVDIFLFFWRNHVKQAHPSEF